MKKLYLFAILSFALVAHCLITTMEEAVSPVLQDLPPEMVLAITPFLGNKLEEMLENIGNLARVNKRFNALLSENKQVLGKRIKRDVGEEAIQIALKDILKAGNLKKVKLFRDLELLDKLTIDNMILTVLTELLLSADADRIKQLFKEKIITADTPFVEGQLIPLTDILGFFRHYHDTQNAEKLTKIADLMSFLVENNYWDLRAEHESGHPELVRALVTYNVPLLEFLLDHGLDPNTPENKKRIDSIVKTIKFNLQHVAQERDSRMLAALKKRGLAE